MEEKEKRQEKQKNKPKNKIKGAQSSSGFIIASFMMFVLFLMGIGLIMFIITRPSVAEIELRQTMDSIDTTNQTALTQIFASATASIRNATETAEAGRNE